MLKIYLEHKIEGGKLKTISLGQMFRNLGKPACPNTVTMARTRILDK